MALFFVVDAIAFVFSSFIRSPIFSAAVDKVANIYFRLRGVRCSRSRSTASVMIYEDLFKIVLLLSISASLSAFSKAIWTFQTTIRMVAFVSLTRLSGSSSMASYSLFLSTVYADLKSTNRWRLVKYKNLVCC